MEVYSWKDLTHLFTVLTSDYVQYNETFLSSRGYLAMFGPHSLIAPPEERLGTASVRGDSMWFHIHQSITQKQPRANNWLLSVRFEDGSVHPVLITIFDLYPAIWTEPWINGIEPFLVLASKMSPYLPSQKHRNKLDGLARSYLSVSLVRYTNVAPCLTRFCEIIPENIIPDLAEDPTCYITGTWMEYIGTGKNWNNSDPTCIEIFFDCDIDKMTKKCKKMRKLFGDNHSTASHSGTYSYFSLENGYKVVIRRWSPTEIALRPVPERMFYHNGEFRCTRGAYKCYTEKRVPVFTSTSSSVDVSTPTSSSSMDIPTDKSNSSTEIPTPVCGTSTKPKEQIVEPEEQDVNYTVKSKEHNIASDRPQIEIEYKSPSFTPSFGSSSDYNLLFRFNSTLSGDVNIKTSGVRLFVSATPTHFIFADESSDVFRFGNNLTFSMQN